MTISISVWSLMVKFIWHVINMMLVCVAIKRLHFDPHTYAPFIKLHAYLFSPSTVIRERTRSKNRSKNNSESMKEWKEQRRQNSWRERVRVHSRWLPATQWCDGMYSTAPLTTSVTTNKSACVCVHACVCAIICSLHLRLLLAPFVYVTRLFSSSNVSVM